MGIYAYKGDIMEVSSSTQSLPAETANETVKKTAQAEEQQAQKTRETVDEQSKEMNAQKTGIGNNINITG